MSRGMFITLEGPEGGGKSTHAERLAGRLRGIGYEVITTREPGGTPLGEVIRGILKEGVPGDPLTHESEALLFAGSRAQIVSRLIRPSLRRGAWVICDRFVDSTTAYQAYGRGLDLGQIRALNGLATGGLAPDVTFLLDISVSRGSERLRQRNADTGGAYDRIEREDASFHERVRAGYLAIAAAEPERIVRIDADRDVEVVAADLWSRLTERMNRDEE